MKKNSCQIKLIFALLLFTGFLLCCSNSENGGKTDVSDAAFITLENGEFSNYSLIGGNLVEEPKLFRFVTETAFFEFWMELKGRDDEDNLDDIPTINFNEYMVIVLLDKLEIQTGYTIKIDNLIDTGEQITIQATKTTSIGPSCSGDDSHTQPYSIIKTRHTEKELVLSLDEETIVCE